MLPAEVTGQVGGAAPGRLKMTRDELAVSPHRFVLLNFGCTLVATPQPFKSVVDCVSIHQAAVVTLFTAQPCFLPSLQMPTLTFPLLSLHIYIYLRLPL